jgi:methylmalonyl-CoA/ethylmalonyl-CoA epimerase
MPKVKRIDHIALVVENLESPLSFWQDALGLNLSGTLHVPQEEAKIAFLPLGSSEIELVHPTNPESGLGKYLEKRGPGMHHICLEVDDIEGMLDQLRAKGIQLINETPRLGEGGRRYAFIHPKSAYGVLVELYEYRADVGKLD